MNVKYCLPLIKSRSAEIRQAIQDNFNKYSYFEVWLDYVEDLDETFIQQLIRQLNNHLIVVFRRQQLQPISMPLNQRYRILDLLQSSDVLVDLDITQQKSELEHIKQKNLDLEIIASYHNYEQTPGSVQLETIIDKMKGYRPAVYKLATMCHSQEDGLRLLQLLLKLKQQEYKAIVLGMGEYGASTRVLGALWGNEMTFAPLTTGGQSAPGQLTKDQLENIFKELEQ